MGIAKTISTIFGVFFFVLITNAQKEGLEKIDTCDLKTHLTFIASDELQGRRFGTEVDGLGMAADYIAANARRLGLKPGFPDYFQKVDLVSTKTDASNFIEVVNEKGNSLYKSDLLVEMHHPEEPQLLKNIPVVLAGFGDNINRKDVKGKAVVVSVGSKESYNEGSSRWNNRLERAKMDSLIALKPALVFVVSSVADKQNKAFKQIKSWYGRERFGLAKPENGGNVATLLVLPEFADALLGGNNEYEKYLNETAGTDKPGVREVEGNTVNVKDGRLQIPVDAKNVVAILEGSDPELKKECVVFMAHYDHLGMDENGEVYNGADDNGSGTVTIMEVAEAFAALHKKPKRSIVFLWVTGEELGLLGSEYYTSNPVFPPEKTVACFNLDMVGRVFEDRDTVWNRSAKRIKDFDGLFTLSNNVWPELQDINQRFCKKLGLEPDTTLPPPFLRSSDHYHFHKNNIPILNYATGYHADYHKIGDEVDKINFEKMKRVAELCFLVGLEVANKSHIKINAPDQ